MTVPALDRVAETGRLADQLHREGLNLLGLVVNRISPFGAPRLLEELNREHNDHEPGCMGELREFVGRIGADERRAMVRLKETFPNLPAIALPLLPEDPAGLEEMAHVADLLETAPSPTDLPMVANP